MLQPSYRPDDVRESRRYPEQLLLGDVPEGHEPATEWEPVGVRPRYAPARAAVDPDPSLGWIRRLRPLLASHRAAVVLSISAALIAMLAQVAIPRVTMSAIDDGLASQTRALWPFVAVLVALGAIRGLLTFVYRYGLYSLAFKLEFELRTLLYGHLTRLSFGFFDRVQSGQIISRANSDIRSVQLFLAFAPIMAVQIASFAIALTIMLTIHVGLTIVALAALPGVYLAAQKLRKITFPLSWIVQSRLADVASIVDENVNGVRVVKSFAAEEQQVGVLAKAAQRLQWAAVEQVDARARHNPVIENLPRVGMAFVLLYGGILAIDGTVTIGALVAFNFYIVMMQAPFRFLGFLLVMAQRAKASAERIYEIFDEPIEIVDRPGAVDLVDPTGSVRFEGVSFAYSADGPEVLSELDLSIGAGDTVAVVGATGSGKTTVARLLLRFYDTGVGAVTIDGLDVRDLTLASLRHHVGIVTDEPFLFSASLHDNIAFARPGASRDDVVAAATAANAHGFIGNLDDGYDTVIGERGYDLSGGQRQRIAIARTLLADPKILILDGATSAIDVRVEEEIHDALRALMVDRTTIIIAHRLSTISLAERVVLLRGGSVAATGTHRELLDTEPHYVDILARAGATDADADADAMVAD